VEARVSHSSPVPDVLPILSRGKHRNPRRGACFMELASYLAGERWSDAPACTHPVLAEVARNVNDRTTDDARPLLAPLIPAVIGLTTDDPRADARIALHCALLALPVATAQRQGALAVAVLSSERVLGALGDDTPYELRLRIRRTLEQEPHALRWARRFAARAGGPKHATSVRRYRRIAAHDIVKLAARGIAEADPGDRDTLLRSMLEGAIEQCRQLQAEPAAPAAVEPDRWIEACALTT
jgi:hypothetical protein